MSRVSRVVDIYDLEEILKSVNEASVRCNSCLPNVIICNIGSYLPIQLNIMVSAKLNLKVTKNILVLNNTDECRYDCDLYAFWYRVHPKIYVQQYGNINTKPMKVEMTDEWTGCRIRQSRMWNNEVVSDKWIILAALLQISV